jgi:hypothetical protein
MWETDIVTSKISLLLIELRSGRQGAAPIRFSIEVVVAAIMHAVLVSKRHSRFANSKNGMKNDKKWR